MQACFYISCITAHLSLEISQFFFSYSAYILNDRTILRAVASKLVHLNCLTGLSRLLPITDCICVLISKIVVYAV